MSYLYILSGYVSFEFQSLARDVCKYYATEMRSLKAEFIVFVKFILSFSSLPITRFPIVESAPISA